MFEISNTRLILQEYLGASFIFGGAVRANLFRSGPGRLMFYKTH